jgi:hypothetical protein
MTTRSAIAGESIRLLGSGCQFGDELDFVYVRRVTVPLATVTVTSRDQSHSGGFLY